MDKKIIYDRTYIEQMKVKGECKKCYEQSKGAIQQCEVMGVCKYDKKGFKDYIRSFG